MTRALKRVLMITPHFPPDTSAATHRVRLLAPHLSAYGWEPTILTLAADSYEGRLDYGVESLVQPELRIVRARALSAGWTRKFGVGDLGLRALPGLWKAASELMKRERFDVLFITTYPIYPALLGPRIKRRFGVPFVLDYQDPWVGAWGKSVGPGPDRKPNLKSRVSRFVAEVIEPVAVRAANGITAVSEGTYVDIQNRIDSARNIPTLAIPLGGEARDYARLAGAPSRNLFFDPADGLFHLCYVGTLLPLGVETLRAVLSAIGIVASKRPELAERLRVYFLGTSNQTSDKAAGLVTQHAESFGVAPLVTEHPARIDYLDALRVQADASAVLLMGSTEHHYTASKVYPALLSGRPLLAAFHERSSVSDLLRSISDADQIRLVTYDDNQRADSKSSAIAEHLIALMETPGAPRKSANRLPFDYTAEGTAQKLAGLFDRVLEKN